MKQVIFLGAPGSGKGTQAKLLVADCGFNHLSTGDLLRDEVAKESELGLKVKNIMENGELVGDDIVLELLKINCDLTGSQYLFDGFPRNLAQAKALDELVLGGTESVAVYLDLDLDVLLERLVNRRTCGDCGAIYNLVHSAPKVAGTCDKCGGSNLLHRDDDKALAVSKRLEVFKNTITPVLEYYEQKGNLRRIDASQNKDQVLVQMKETLGC